MDQSIMETDLLASVTRETLGGVESYNTSNNYNIPMYNHHQQQFQQQQLQQQQQQQQQKLHGQATQAILQEMNGNLQRIATIMDRELGMINVNMQKLELALTSKTEKDSRTRRDKIVVPIEFEWLPTKMETVKPKEQKPAETKPQEKRLPEKRRHEGQGMYNKPSYDIKKKAK